jgi:hypothetical protein
MKHRLFLTIFFVSVCFQAFAKSDTDTTKWNPACEGLLENSISSTLKLEKTLAKRKKKMTTNTFNQKIQDELMVVQLNAWVCAVSTDRQLGASVEEQFLKEYARKVQQRSL